MESYSDNFYQVKDCECGERIVTVGTWAELGEARCPHLDMSDPLWWFRKTDHSHMSYTVIEQGFTAYPINWLAEVAERHRIMDEAIKRTGFDKAVANAFANRA